MIQDIAPHTWDITYKNIQPDPDSRVLFFSRGQLLVQQECTNAREMAEQSSNEILQEAHNKADLAVKKANAEIASERKKAINEIKNEISEISIDIAEHVVGREIDEKDHTELINDFIENIGD